MKEDRRHPHLPFDPDVIRDFLAGRTLQAADLIHSGKCNTNYRLHLAGGEIYVLRLRSRGDAGHESYVMNLVRGLVPVPEEVARGETWSVYTFLEGAPLADRMEFCDRAAEAMARIHSVTFDAAGWIRADGTVEPFDFGGGDDFVTAILRNPEVRAWIGPEAAEAIPAIMERESGRMAEMGGPCLVHGDYNPTNILVSNGRVSGVLDWEFSHAGTPYMDIGNLLRHADPSLHEGIRRGLEAGGMRVPDDWRERAWLIDVTSHLEFLTSGLSDDFKRRCVERIHAFVKTFQGNEH